MSLELDITRTVKKSNILNEMRDANATVVQYRLFIVYLAHLSMNSDSNVVTFRLTDYARIVGLDRPRPEDLKSQSKEIFKIATSIRNDRSGFDTVPLFYRFRLFKEENEWMVSIECHPDIAPQIREDKGRFLRYKLYNTIYLKSYNQQRLYEILKQYERIGERTVTLEELRSYLSINKDEYPVWGVFARDVLKIAQKSLKEKTDIWFDFEPIIKNRKTVAVRFIIHKNHDFVDKLQLESYAAGGDIEYEGEEFVAQSDDFDDELEQLSIFDHTEPEHKYSSEHIEFLASACGYEFSDSQMKIIINLDNFAKLNDFSQSLGINQERKHQYLSRKYAELNAAAEKTEIEYRFAYFKTLIENDKYLEMNERQYVFN